MYKRRFSLLIYLLLVCVSSAVGQQPKTLPELRAKIAEVLAKPELSSAMVGIKVVSLDNGRVLFEENAGKLLRPASNMKLYTVAAALDRLSPDYRFSTSVYANTRPDAAGVVHGNLIIYGRGDPSLAARFNNGDYFKGINDLADRIVAAGVKRVEGDLVGGELLCWSKVRLRLELGRLDVVLRRGNHATHGQRQRPRSLRQTGHCAGPAGLDHNWSTRSTADDRQQSNYVWERPEARALGSPRLG